MSAQIAAGNSGGPAFDDDGKQIGLNTYGGSSCANSSERVLAGDFYLVTGGDGRGVIVEKLLDLMVDFLPSPLDVDEIWGKNPKTGDEVSRKPSDKEPLSALAFKIAADPFVGKLIFVRVYSGVLTSGSYVLNTTTGEKERIGRIVRMFADKREEISKVEAGDIAAVVGLKSTATGNTLADVAHPIALESIEFPEPPVSIAVEPKSKADQEKMALALQRLAEEDPTFRIHTDEETGQTIMSGMGELHLDILIDRMKREFKVEANIGEPQVAFRESIKGRAEVQGKHAKQSGGRGQYGDVWVRFEPNETGKGFEFVDEIKGGVVPQEYRPAVMKGIRETLEGGVIAGYPVVDVKATLYDGKQIGLNTYGGSSCANSSERNNSCFGEGIFRDIADLKTMAKKNNVALSANGELTKLWKDGLESFSQGKYSQAKAKFEQLDKKYPDNYLVAKMIEVSSNTPDDSTESEASSAEAGASESENNTTVIIVVVVILSTGALFLTVSIIAIAVSVSNRRKMNTYPYPVAGQFPQQPQYPQQSYQQPIPPQQQYPQQNYYPQQPGQYSPTYVQPPIE
jgi:hypothetical protein